MMRIDPTHRLKHIAIAVALFAGYVGGLRAQPTPAPSSEPLRAFAAVLQAFSRNSVYAPQEELLVRRAIDGLVAFDPYARYVEDDELRGSLRRDLTGVGIEIAVRGTEIRIVNTTEGGPASQAGLGPNDVIFQIDDTDVTNRSLAEVQSLILGKVGSDVQLTVQKRGESTRRQVTLRRSAFPAPARFSTVMPGQIGYVRTRFDRNLTLNLVADLVDVSGKGPLRGLILDMRSTVGRSIEDSIALAGTFLSDGAVISKVEHGASKSKGEIRADIPTIGKAGGAGLLPLREPFKHVRIAVLIDSGTAGAPEVAAAALHAHGRAFLVGEPSFGRGAVQTFYRLAKGGVLLTNMLCIAPTGAPIDGIGLQPDFSVESAVLPDQFRGSGDAALRKAIEVLTRN